jgi:hypothetical protein
VAAQPEIGADRLTDLSWQGHSILAAGLAADRDLRAAPIDVVQS